MSKGSTRKTLSWIIFWSEHLNCVQFSVRARHLHRRSLSYFALWASFCLRVSFLSGNAIAVSSWKWSLKIAKHYCHKGRVSLEDRWKDNKSFLFLILVKEKPVVKEAGKVFSKRTHAHILFVKFCPSLNFWGLTISCTLVSALRNVQVGLAVGRLLYLEM